MRTDTRPGFDPAALKRLYGAFDTAWDSLKDSTNPADQERVRGNLQVIGPTRGGGTGVPQGPFAQLDDEAVLLYRCGLREAALRPHVSWHQRALFDCWLASPRPAGFTLGKPSLS